MFFCDFVTGWLGWVNVSNVIGWIGFEYQWVGLNRPTANSGPSASITTLQLVSGCSNWRACTRRVMSDDAMRCCDCWSKWRLWSSCQPVRLHRSLTLSTTRYTHVIVTVQLRLSCRQKNEYGNFLHWHAMQFRSFLSLYHNCDSTTIRLRYGDTTTHSTTTEVIEITICVRFDCDTTTTKNWHVHFLLASNWKQARATRRSRIVVVS